MAGTDSIMTPSTVKAAAAVPRVEESEVCTAAAVVEAGTAMVAVMSTLAAVMAMATAELSTPATAAIELWREVVFVSSKSLTLPLAVIVSTTDDGSGGKGDGIDGRGGARGGDGPKGGEGGEGGCGGGGSIGGGRSQRAQCAPVLHAEDAAPGQMLCST